MPTPTDKQELIERIAKHLPEELWNDLSYSDLLFHIATAWLEDREKAVLQAQIDQVDNSIFTIGLARETGQDSAGLLMDIRGRLETVRRALTKSKETN